MRQIKLHNETSLSPVRVRGMVYGVGAIILSIDKRDQPFDKFICHIGDFSLIVYSK